MKTIADIIEDWKALNTPIEKGCGYVFEKDCVIEENPNKPMECKITMILRDNFTYRNGKYNGWSQVNVFLTEHQNDEPTLKAIENQQFAKCLQKFTKESVIFRRKELNELREAGEIITFQSTI